MPAISEYAGLASGQRTVFHPPADLGEVVRWLGVLLAAYFALRILGAMLRWLRR